MSCKMVHPELSVLGLPFCLFWMPCWSRWHFNQQLHLTVELAINDNHKYFSFCVCVFSFFFFLWSCGCAVHFFLEAVTLHFPLLHFIWLIPKHSQLCIFVLFSDGITSPFPCAWGNLMAPDVLLCGVLFHFHALLNTGCQLIRLFIHLADIWEVFILCQAPFHFMASNKMKLPTPLFWASTDWYRGSWLCTSLNEWHLPAFLCLCPNPGGESRAGLRGCDALA